MDRGKRPPKEKKKVSKEALVLRHYLSQFYRATEQRKRLEERLKNICEEMNAPIGGMHYSPVNVSSGKVSQGSAAFTFRKSEIETRIEEQKKQIEADLLKIMDILDYLDPASDERIVLELYYIDRLSWDKVQEKAHMSRSTCYEKRDKGIEKLLTFKRVRAIVRKYAEERGL